MNRRPEAINRTDAEGNPERLCKTPGCGWYRLYERFYFARKSGHAGGGAWSARCIDCIRWQTHRAKGRPCRQMERNLPPEVLPIVRPRAVPRNLPIPIPDDPLVQTRCRGAAAEVPSLAWADLLR